MSNDPAFDKAIALLDKLTADHKDTGTKLQDLRLALDIRAMLDLPLNAAPLTVTCRIIDSFGDPTTRRDRRLSSYDRVAFDFDNDGTTGRVIVKAPDIPASVAVAHNLKLPPTRKARHGARPDPQTK